MYLPTSIDERRRKGEAMLTTEERQEIEGKLAHYPNKQAICIEAMLVVQRHHGWVSDESLRDLSALLCLSVADIDGVATFYNLIRRQPVGRHVAANGFAIIFAEVWTHRSAEQRPTGASPCCPSSVWERVITHPP
jgi:hypothetical protein